MRDGRAEWDANYVLQIQTNAFDRSDPDTGMAGIFLEPTLAMVKHSCVPNAFVSFDKRVAFLRAEREIKEGEDIEISYTGGFVRFFSQNYATG